MNGAMQQGLAYHTVVEAMQDRHRLDAGMRFALAIKSCVDGHREYAVLRSAASERRVQGWSDESVSKAVVDWLQTDLNPAAQLGRATADISKIVAGYNLYNEAVNLGVRTNFESGGFHRHLISAARDDALCAAATQTLLRVLIGEASTLHADEKPEIKSGWRVALYLGAERLASAEAMRLLEDQGDFDLRTLAAALGCSPRTLQRQVAADGLSITDLRMAARQQRAFRLIQCRTGLCQAAHEAGYADQAHMARSIKAACGLTPRQIAKTLA